MSSAPKVSLNAQIIALEERVVRHRISLSVDTQKLEQTIRRHATSGGALFAALCLGVTLGRKRGSGSWSVLTLINAINASATLVAALLPATSAEPIEPGPSDPA